MPRTHLEQIPVPDPKLPPSLTAFADCLKTSYFYPSGSYEKCEDPRVPGVWSETLSGKFGPYIKVRRTSFPYPREKLPSVVDVSTTGGREFEG